LKKVEQKNPKKAKRIRKHNLGRKKLVRRKQKHQVWIKTIVFTAVNRVVDKAKTIVCEDLTKNFKSLRAKEFDPSLSALALFSKKCKPWDLHSEAILSRDRSVVTYSQNLTLVTPWASIPCLLPPIVYIEAPTH
jgi:hypothetical protein